MSQMLDESAPILWPRETWEWFGNAAHFICGRWCRFHLTTKVGPWLVSTIGEYVHPRNSGGSERKEAEWLKENWPGEDIGPGRKYETMVFRAGAPCDCGCGLPGLVSGLELYFRPYNSAAEATKGHHEACEEWSRVSIESCKQEDDE